MTEKNLLFFWWPFPHSVQKHTQGRVNFEDAFIFSTGCLFFINGYEVPACEMTRNKLVIHSGFTARKAFHIFKIPTHGKEKGRS